MSSKISVAAIQYAFDAEVEINRARGMKSLDEAGRRGVQLAILPEFYDSMYFCQTQDFGHFAGAIPWQEHPGLPQTRALAKKYSMVVVLPFFEREGVHFYNSAAVIDADGSLLGIYRKTHIPDGPGYQEKYYFRPGNLGLRVWKTKVGRVGLGICWDQWFPEVARELVLNGADILAYPSAIGSEPNSPDLDTRHMWQSAMVGHAVCNLVPLVASNRVGREKNQNFYGSSFITCHMGVKLAEGGRDQAEIVQADVCLASPHTERAAFGFFRDRRPDLYKKLFEA